VRVASAVGAAVGPAVGAAVKAWRSAPTGERVSEGGEASEPERIHKERDPRREVVR
jgi:hypothetical protein